MSIDKTEVKTADKAVEAIKKMEDKAVETASKTVTKEMGTDTLDQLDKKDKVVRVERHLEDGNNIGDGNLEYKMPITKKN